MNLDQPKWPNQLRIALYAALPLAFVYLMLRNTGLYPTVFGDEWSYSSAARLLPLSAAPLPSYLYLALFGATNACGAAFLDCARGLNALLFIGAAPFIFALGRRVAPAPLAAVAALASILGPLNAYTTYFMPEATYFFLFWLLSWCALGLHAQPGAVRAATTGLALGALSLVKVHALFLLPGLCVLILHAVAGGPAPGTLARRVGRALALAAGMLAVAAAVRFGVGYLLAGANGLSLMGSLYQEQAEYSAKLRKPLALLLELAGANLQGHGLALVLLFGVPLAAMLAFGVGGARRRAAPRPVRGLMLYSALTLLALLPITALFTASVAGNGPSENVFRLHMRYYNFALPLLLLCAASQVDAGAVGTRRWRGALAGALIVVLAYACWALPAHYTPSYIDSPELRGVTVVPALNYGLGALAAASLAAWALTPRLGLRLYLYLCLPLMTLSGALLINRDISQARNPDRFDLAGMAARAQLSRADAERLTIAGADHAGLYKAKFHLDAPQAQLLPVAPGTPMDLTGLRNDGWLLLIGDVAPPPYTQLHSRGAEHALYRFLAPAQWLQVDFKTTLPAALGVSGLGAAEAWGRWSAGKSIEFHFDTPLPAQAIVRITSHAFGPNVGEQAVVSLGSQRLTLPLTGYDKAQALRFDNAGGERRLTIIVPQPVSPQALGMGDDPRQLGIGLVSMDIGSMPAAALAKNSLPPQP